MKSKKEIRNQRLNDKSQILEENSVRSWNGSKPRLFFLSCLVLATGLLCNQRTHALTFVPLGEGTLPSGQIVSMFQVTFDPGEAFPWHFHPGPLWGVIVSGTLTEDQGCGTALNTYAAGSAFAETPGRVHRVFNYGTVPVVINFTTVVSSCYSNYNSSILVDGPKCQGTSGRSLLEKVPVCALNSHRMDDGKLIEQKQKEQPAVTEKAVADKKAPLNQAFTLNVAAEYSSASNLRLTGVR